MLQLLNDAFFTGDYIWINNCTLIFVGNTKILKILVDNKETYESEFYNKF